MAATVLNRLSVSVPGASYPSNYTISLLYLSTCEGSETPHTEQFVEILPWSLDWEALRS